MVEMGVNELVRFVLRTRIDVRFQPRAGAGHHAARSVEAEPLTADRHATGSQLGGGSIYEGLLDPSASGFVLLMTSQWFCSSTTWMGRT
jgi:hypothetical protein